ncbi:MAG: substrate-binding domain-containing protein [Treponema sp.]|nr:substrate-binding domain-containing protein [Treponema sp.]
MKVTRRVLFIGVCLILAALMVFTACGGKSQSAGGGKVKVYFIPKNLGNPYFVALSSGFDQALKELDPSSAKYEYIFTGPATPEATSQIEYVEAAVQNGAKAIFIAANSNDALNGTFDDARAKGTRIYIINQDIPGSETHRDAAILPTNFDTIGVAQLDLLHSLIGGQGEFAILSATTDAPDQNYWVQLMRDELAKGNPKYAQMRLVDVVYGDDQPEKSTTEMEALLTKYPNLRGVIAPTTVGIAAATKVVQTRGIADRVIVTGLGLPSEMKQFIVDGSSKGFQLWDPPAEGYLGLYMVDAELNAGFTPTPGASFSAGRLGTIKIEPSGQIFTIPQPKLFNKDNLDDFVY